MIYHASLTAIVVFLFFVGLVLAISFYLGSAREKRLGLFRGAWADRMVRQRLRVRGRLPVGGVVSGHLRVDRVLRIRWISIFDRLSRGLDRRAVRDGRADQAAGEIHVRRCAELEFNSRGIQIAAAISTLVVSIFYLIPQMVGAGALCTPLLGLPHWAGVVIVGVVVLTIVVTAGMVSTTWVQFIKGSLLVIFCAILSVAILVRRISRDREPRSNLNPSPRRSRATSPSAGRSSTSAMDRRSSANPPARSGRSRFCIRSTTCMSCSGRPNPIQREKA